MNIVERIHQLRLERGWSVYRLSKEADIPASTLRNYNKNHLPSFPTLERIVEAFGLTLSQFFADGEYFLDLTEDEKRLIRTYKRLEGYQKTLVMKALDSIASE